MIRYNITKDLKAVPTIEGQLVMLENKDGTVSMYYDRDIGDDNLQRIALGGAADPIHIPVNQSPVQVSSKQECFDMCPDDMNIYFMAHVEFLNEKPGGSGLPFLVIVRKDMLGLIAFGRRHTYSCYKDGGAWTAWTEAIRTIPTWSNLTLEGAKTSMQTYPSHTEILRAQIAASDNPRPDLGDTWYLDCKAWDAEHFTTIVQGYGEEYINQRTQIGVDPDTSAPIYGWTGWKSTSTKVEKYFESTAMTDIDWQGLKDWVDNNVPDADNKMYNITWADVQFIASVSPTGVDTTHYQVESEKLSDHSLLVYATVLSGATAEYPVGTRFRCVVSEALVQSSWQLVSLANGVIEIPDAQSTATRAGLLASASTIADREIFTVVYDSVQFTALESPTGGAADTFWVELVSTSSRQFMRASFGTLVNGVYKNQLFYSRLVSGTWSAWSKVNALAFTEYNPVDIITDSLEATDIPTGNAVIGYVTERLEALDVPAIGTLNKSLITDISEQDGFIDADAYTPGASKVLATNADGTLSAKDFKTSIDSTAADTMIPSSKAVKDYVDAQSGVINLTSNSGILTADQLLLITRGNAIVLRNGVQMFKAETDSSALDYHWLATGENYVRLCTINKSTGVYSFNLISSPHIILQDATPLTADQLELYNSFPSVLTMSFTDADSHSITRLPYIDGAYRDVRYIGAELMQVTVSISGTDGVWSYQETPVAAASLAQTYDATSTSNDKVYTVNAVNTVIGNIDAILVQLTTGTGVD